MKMTDTIWASRIVVARENSSRVALLTKFIETAIAPYNTAEPIDSMRAPGGLLRLGSSSACTRKFCHYFSHYCSIVRDLLPIKQQNMCLIIETYVE